MSAFFEDANLNDLYEIGSFIFSKDAIADFAGAYDPNPLSLDAEAALRGPFGAIVASGWHVAGIWMRLMIDFHKRQTANQIAAGQAVARMGPSPGFRNLLWKNPVYAGDEISFSMEIVGKRDVKSQPDWGLLLIRNQGKNRDGEPVFLFDGAVFIERAERL